MPKTYADLLRAVRRKGKDGPYKRYALDLIYTTDKFLWATGGRVAVRLGLPAGPPMPDEWVDHCCILKGNKLTKGPDGASHPDYSCVYNATTSYHKSVPVQVTATINPGMAWADRLQYLLPKHKIYLSFARFSKVFQAMGLMTTSWTMHLEQQGQTEPVKFTTPSNLAGDPQADLVLAEVTRATDRTNAVVWVMPFEPRFYE